MRETFRIEKFTYSRYVIRYYIRVQVNVCCIEMKSRSVKEHNRSRRTVTADVISFECWTLITSRYFIRQTTYLLRLTSFVCNTFIRDGETIGRVRGPAAAVSRARSVVAVNAERTVPAFERRSRTRNAFAYRQSRTALARCRPRHVKIPPHFRDARDKKRRARRGDLTDGRGVSADTGETAAPTSFTDLDGVTATTTTGDAIPKCTLGLYFASRMDTPPLPEEEKKNGKSQSSGPRARVLRAAHDPDVRPLCVHRSTDRLVYHQGCVNARESGIREYPTGCPGPMTHRLREH